MSTLKVHFVSCASILRAVLLQLPLLGVLQGAWLSSCLTYYPASPWSLPQDTPTSCFSLIGHCGRPRVEEGWTAGRTGGQ